ncbi:Troponin I 4 [Fragariocoptes setiger]|uniref:Troponin I 4 n=1 Tax=Fragariocoptes setiger TaxID=1670756 RepID=A0ABQ7S9F4_9ACAR|nr:Troponin I 4 [Fragariocoptes setiger]
MDHDNIMDGPSSRGRGSFLVNKRRLPSIAELSANISANHQLHHQFQSQQQQQQKKYHQHQQQKQIHQQIMQMQRQRQSGGIDMASKCFSAIIIGGQYRNRHHDTNNSSNSNALTVNSASSSTRSSNSTRKQISPAASMMLDTRRAKQQSKYSSHSHNHHHGYMNKSICSPMLASPKFVYNMTLLALVLMAPMLAVVATSASDVGAVPNSNKVSQDVGIANDLASKPDSSSVAVASHSGIVPTGKHASEGKSEASAKKVVVEAKSSSFSSANERKSKNMASTINNSKPDKTKAELRSAAAAASVESASSSVAAKAASSGPYSSFYKASDDNHLKHKLKRFLPLLSMGSSSGKPNSKASHLPRTQASLRADVPSSSSSHNRPTPFLVKKASVDRQGGGVSSLLANPLGLGLLFSMPSLLLTPLAIAGLAPAMSAINNFFGDDDESSSSSSSSSSGPLSSLLNSGSQSSSSGSQSLAASALSSILGPPPQAEKPMFNPGMFLNSQGVGNAIGSLSSGSSSSSSGGSSSSGVSSMNPFKNLFGGGGNSLMQASASVLSPSYAAAPSSSSSSSSDSDDGPGLMQMASEVFGKLVGSDKDQGSSSSSPFSFSSLTGLSSLLGGASQASGASPSSSSSATSSHTAPRLGFFSTLKGVYELFSSGLRRQESGDNLECQQRLMCEIHQRALGSKLFRRSLTRYDKAILESQLQQQLSKLYTLATSQQPMTPQRQQQLSLLQARVDQETKNYLNDFFRTLSRQSNQSAGETLDCGTLFPRCSRNIMLTAATGLGLGSFDSSSVGSRSMNKLTSLMKKMKFKSSQQLKQQKQSGVQDPLLKGAVMQPQGFLTSSQDNAKLMQQMMLTQEYQQQQQQQQQQLIQPNYQTQSSMNTYNDGQYYSQYFANSKSQMPPSQQPATAMNYNSQYPQTTMTPMMQQGYGQPGAGQQQPSDMMYQQQQPNGPNGGMQGRQAQYQPEGAYNPSVPQQNIQQQVPQQQAQPQQQPTLQQQSQQQQNVQLSGSKQPQTDSSQMMKTFTMNETLSQEEQRKREERDRKKAEVRARLEAQAAIRSKKKGFMTPERKKKLRLLLRRKAAEELKRQQEAKAAERRKVIADRCGPKKNFDTMSESELQLLCKQFHDRLTHLESEKWDIEYQVGRKDLEIHELSNRVSDLRGKFVKPPLKKVPKYEAKIERMLLNARKEIGFTVTLKSVKKDQFKVDEPKDNTSTEPEWSWKKQQEPVNDKE